MTPVVILDVIGVCGFSIVDSGNRENKDTGVGADVGGEQHFSLEQ